MSKFFINRPIVAMVISIVLVIVGAITILSLPIAQFPQHRSAGDSSPGHLRRRGRPKRWSRAVATPIEQQMIGVDNINYMYSLNATGNSNTTLIVNFDVKTDPNTDLILTQARESRLPRNSPPMSTTTELPSENL